ncbi:hypothetical protein ACFFOP_30835 [Sinosporangium siamense]|uniref:hypothetical protein n=1 Tax=Sinosporangium siamense TaxID=1367973 RepID=UPI0035E5E0F1
MAVASALAVVGAGALLLLTPSGRQAHEARPAAPAPPPAPQPRGSSTGGLLAHGAVRLLPPPGSLTTRGLPQLTRVARDPVTPRAAPGRPIARPATQVRPPPGRPHERAVHGTAQSPAAARRHDYCLRFPSPRREACRVMLDHLFGS